MPKYNLMIVDLLKMREKIALSNAELRSYSYSGTSLYSQSGGHVALNLSVSPALGLHQTMIPD